MTDDLVSRLRSLAGRTVDLPTHYEMTEAADRIEELEAALGALWWGVGENGAPDELLEKTKDALKGTKYD